MSRTLACILVVFLVACGTGVNGERYYGLEGSSAWRDAADPETIRTYYEEKCSIYGYKPNTVEMDTCVERTLTDAENEYREAMRKIFLD